MQKSRVGLWLRGDNIDRWHDNLSTSLFDEWHSKVLVKGSQFNSVQRSGDTYPIAHFQLSSPVDGQPTTIIKPDYRPWSSHLDHQTYNGYVFPAVGQKSWWFFFTQGTPRMISPRISKPNASERAVHQICNENKGRNKVVISAMNDLPIEMMCNMRFLDPN